MLRYKYSTLYNIHVVEISQSTVRNDVPEQSFITIKWQGDSMADFQDGIQKLELQSAKTMHPAILSSGCHQGDKPLLVICIF